MLRVMTPPASLPITVGELKDWSRIYREDEDAIFEESIRSATTLVEGWSGHSLIERTLELTLEDLCGDVVLAAAPVMSIVSFETRSTPDDAYETVSADRYVTEFPSLWDGRISLRSGKSWPTISEPSFAAVRVRFIAGYTAGSVPPALRQGVCVVAQRIWEERRTDPGFVEAAAGLLSPFVRKRGFA